MNTLEHGMEKQSYTKDVYNAIRMNKGLFNEEASHPPSRSLPIQLFHYSDWKVRAAGLLIWLYRKPQVNRVKTQSNHQSERHFYSVMSCGAHLHLTLAPLQLRYDLFFSIYIYFGIYLILASTQEFHHKM